MEITKMKKLDPLLTSLSLRRKVHSIPRRYQETFLSSSGADGGETNIKDAGLCLPSRIFFLTSEIDEQIFNSLDKILHSGKTSGRLFRGMVVSVLDIVNTTGEWEGAKNR